jgi:hypothetical protein
MADFLAKSNGDSRSGCLATALALAGVLALARIRVGLATALALAGILALTGMGGHALVHLASLIMGASGDHHQRRAGKPRHGCCNGESRNFFLRNHNLLLICREMRQLTSRQRTLPEATSRAKYISALQYLLYVVKVYSLSADFFLTHFLSESPFIVVPAWMRRSVLLSIPDENESLSISPNCFAAGGFFTVQLIL